MESSGAEGEPFPAAAAEAIAGGLRWSERPCGRAGRATPALDNHDDPETRPAGEGDTREREGETNRAVVIGVGESSPPAPPVPRGSGGDSGGVDCLAFVGPPPALVVIGSSRSWAGLTF